MFVKLKNSPSRGIYMRALALTASCLSIFSVGVPAAAVDGHVNTGTIPVSITIEGVRETTVPLYISVQKRGEYMGLKGHGVILKKTDEGTMRASVNVDVVDDYAISLWHDLDDDGVFSMNDRYQPQDGYAASGTMPTDRAPTFDDVKITVPIVGRAVTVTMVYPN